MKRTLKGSKNTKNPPYTNMEETVRQAQNMNPAQFADMQNIVDHYGTKSESELMDELRYARQQGAINPADLANVAQKLAPMLTPEQQQRLMHVMNQLQ